ncbi:MAG: beta-ketoacyl synthase N-terminal-like domain-containing protein, partial [Kiritimatiellia bacterium]
MRSSREDIVITGMSCRFAEAPNLAAFWRNVMKRRTLFTPLGDLPAGESPPTPLFDRPYPTTAAQLGDLYACTPADQYFPRTINAGENQDVFFTVQLAIDALRDSGSTINNLPTDRVSFRLGYAPPFNAASVNWLQHTFFLDQTL